jgi:hypothetical protein
MKGAAPLDPSAALEPLGDQETLHCYLGERGRPHTRRMVTEKDTTQHRPDEPFSLDTYALKR